MPETLRTFLGELAAAMKCGGDLPEHWLAMALRRLDANDRHTVRDSLAAIAANTHDADHENLRRAFDDALSAQNLTTDGDTLRFLGSLAARID